MCLSDVEKTLDSRNVLWWQDGYEKNGIGRMLKLNKAEEGSEFLMQWTKEGI